MGSRRHRDTVPGGGPGDCSEGTSWLGLTTSRSSYQIEDNYKVLGFIGRGSFGKVFVGRHYGTYKWVAIKELKKTKGQAAYIATEVAILKDLQHRNITQLLEVTESKEYVHLVLEFVHGINLGQVLFCGKRNRLYEEDALTIFQDILEAVNYCHRQGIVHGDLKPGNVLLNTNGRAKLCDFGLAFRFVPGQELSVPGGTPAYFAPERFLYPTYEGPPLDVWALGVILYETITGRHLFSGMPPEINDTIIFGIVRYPDFVSVKVKNLIGKIMNRSAKRRPTAQELLHEQWRQGVRPQSPSGPLPLSAKRAILTHMAEMGFDQLEVMDTLRKKEYNHLMATFLLLQSCALEGRDFRKVGRTAQEGTDQTSWCPPGPKLSPHDLYMASEPVPRADRLFCGLKTHGEQGGRSSLPPMAIQRTTTPNVYPNRASPSPSSQSGPSDPSLSSQSAPAFPSVSSQSDATFPS
ncbi:sperm motility kinase 2B-like, partial [Fukomys damarensis]|uniref:sperm motility kinase 2B-like n=1 Tax=Fukomys damarensis TaxID=885580 RepID=UPI0014556D77